MIHFMLTDIHPFDDGNGRLSRIMKTNELLSANCSRGRPEPLARSLAFCRKATAACVAPDIDQAIETWAGTFAFQEPNQQRLRMPDSTDPVVWRNAFPAPSSHWEEQDRRKASKF